MAEVKLTILGDDKSSPAFRSVNSSVSSLESSMRGLMSVAGLLTTTFAGISIAAVFKKGIEAVDNFQQSVIQTAAMITSLQGGENVAANYLKAKEYAEGLQQTLMQVDARTTLNLANLQALTEEMVKQGIVLDNNNKSQVDGFTNIANAVAVYSRNGSNEMQLRQEVSALMRGEVDQNSQLSSMVQRMVDGPLKQWVEKHKQAGDLVEQLGQKLSGFGLASEDLNKTWSAVKSSLQTSLDLVLRAGFTGIVKEISVELNKVNEYLKTHREEIGDKIKSAWESLKTVMSAVATVAKTVWDNFEPFATVIIGGAIIKGVTGLIEVFTTLGRVLLAVQASMVAVGALSGPATAAAAVGAGGTVAAAGGAAAGGGILAAIGGGLAGAAIAIGGGVALGYALQPAVRKLDKVLYEKYGWMLTGEAFFNEQTSRDQVSAQRLSDVMAKKGQANGPAVPVVSLQDTPAQLAEKLKLQEKELGTYKEMMSQKSALAKGQAAVELDILKGRYDQGLASTREYYEKEKQLALAAAQAEADNAIAYLHKEEAVLDFIKAKKGAKSPEYQEELAKNQKALGDAQKAQLDYAKIYVENENKMTEALKKREEEYQKLQISTLEAAGQYVDAEKAKQAMDEKSIDLLRLRKEAEEGVKGAVDALAAVEKKRATDQVTAQNKENEERRNYASDIVKMRDQLDALNGKDQELIRSEAELRDGRKELASLQDKITLAWSAGNIVAINGLSEKIILQEQLNGKMRDNLTLQEQQKVLNGQIVGFSNGQAIYANGGGAFNNGQPVTPSQSPGGPSSTPDWRSDPFFNTQYSTGIGLSSLPGRAAGGPVLPLGTYLVGEKGPEILRMGNQGGSVIPNAKLGGDTVQFYGDINFTLPNVNDKSTSAALAREVVPEILRMIDIRRRA